MIKKELRIAAVIYGGASLAVYLHGVTKELLKLVRASKVLHEMGRDTDAAYADGPDPRPGDSEAVYFELLKRINEHCHFRVVLDVVAGASAGAINGVMLGKALVDDGEIDSRTWLERADVELLMSQPRSRWQKWYLYPLLRALSFWLPEEIGANEETRSKLTRLVRSSWFEPPFSGSRLCDHLIDALEGISNDGREGSTLLPEGQRLDVYASLTDLEGYPSSIRLHETLAARELEHAALCRLSHTSGAAGSSDFADDNLPALVWAARASSCYAGAFTPFHHSELTAVLEERGREWPREAHFLSGSLFVRDGAPAVQAFDPANRYFVDGGIVNNKPFGAALDALDQRSADRHVERYIVYIEPDPRVDLTVQPDRKPGYLRTIRAALTTIPRNQPILDELNEIVAQDDRVRMNRRLVDANTAKIHEFVESLERQHARQPLSTDLIAYLRLGLGERAIEEMGLAFRAYVQRRIWRLTDALVAEWRLLAEQPDRDETREAMLESVERWWDAETEVTRQNLQDVFLDRFDVTFRIRRLQFVIRRLNQHPEFAALSSESRDALDEFKRTAYQFLEQLYSLRQARKISVPLLDRLARATTRLPLSRQQSGELLRALASSLDLNALDREIDEACYALSSMLDDADARRAFIADYVGFSIYDVLLYKPGSPDSGPDPLTPIRVERISPEDATVLAQAFDGLRCRELMGFLGFFNREHREHDYLWGRLNGAERIVDILVSSSGEDIGDVSTLRHALFRAILEQERPKLTQCAEAFARLDELLDVLGRDAV